MNTDQTSYRLPPQDWRDADAFVFLGFVIHYHESHCACGAVDHWSKPLRIFGHRTLEASRARRFVPFESGWMPNNEPLAIVSLPAESTCVCHHCVGKYATSADDVIHLRVASDERNWLYALMEDQRKTQRAARAAATSGGSTKPCATDADILSM
jgi:hypothetical protein